MADTGQEFTIIPAFGAHLDRFTVEYDMTIEGLVLVCGECLDSICDVEQDDTMHVLIVTVLAHRCDE